VVCVVCWEVGIFLVCWEVELMILAAASRAWILSSRGGIEVLADMISVSLCEFSWSSNASMRMDVRSYFVPNPYRPVWLF
jgi:hypothetical protein